MLLEEVLLHLLNGTGYRTVEAAGTDPTLTQGSAGLEVKGRGGKHQIDAIADFQVQHPFSHKQRVLVEAKCFSPRTQVGIEIARNAVGVLKDVNEYWVAGAASSIAKSRYHYQYALFSATPYTVQAQRYAFAHDIYLIPVKNSTYLTSTVNSIRAISSRDFGVTRAGTIPIRLSQMRRLVREGLRSRTVPPSLDYTESLIVKLANMFQQVLAINYALLAVLGGDFPVFLVPKTVTTIEHLPSVVNVRIRWVATNWYLDDLNDQRLFSFDLPPELFELYAEAGELSRERALNLKQEHLRSFYAFRTIGNEVRVIRFQLDMPWIYAIRERRQNASPNDAARG